MDNGKTTPRTPHRRRDFIDPPDESDISERLKRPHHRSETEKQRPIRAISTTTQSINTANPFSVEVEKKLPPFLQKHIKRFQTQTSSIILKALQQVAPEARISVHEITNGNTDGYAYHFGQALAHEERSDLRDLVLSMHRQFLDAYLKKLAGDFFALCHLQHLSEFTNGPIEHCIPYRAIVTPTKNDEEDDKKNPFKNLRILETISINGLQRCEVLIVANFMTEDDADLFRHVLMNLSKPLEVNEIEEEGINAISASMNKESGYCRLKKENWFHFIKLYHQRKEAQELFNAMLKGHTDLSEGSLDDKIPVKKLASPKGLLALEIADEDISKEKKVLIVVDTSTKEKRNFLNTVLTVAMIAPLKGPSINPQKIGESDNSTLLLIKKENIQRFRALWAQLKRRNKKTSTRRKRKRRNSESSGSHRLSTVS
jgi:hypothetical protein